MDHAFFILGTGRCGSTLLHRLLRDHPQLAITFEARVVNFLWFCTELVRTPPHELVQCELEEHIRMHGLIDEAYAESFAGVFGRHVLPMLAEFYRQQFPGKAFRYWGDKLPHPEAAAAVRAIVPDTRFVLLVRDPRDVVCSYRRYAERPQMRERAPELERVSSEEFAAQWNNLTAATRAHVEPLLVVRYEDLVADPRRWTRAVLDLLELPMTSEVENELLTNATFEPHGTSASPEASIGRWRSELAPDDVATVEAVCGPQMSELGYELSGG